MAEDTAAPAGGPDAVLILAPTYWYQSPSPLKLMIDRLVCADGGNPDPTTTHGKRAAEAQQIEQQGWHYPQHLAGPVNDMSAGRRGGLRSHRGAGGRTLQQLRNEARQHGLKGRSTMNKAALEAALARPGDKAD